MVKKSVKNNKIKNNKTKKVSNNNKSQQLQRQLNKRFILTRDLYPKAKVILLNYNKTNPNINNIKFTFYKNKIELKKLKRHINLHKKHITENIDKSFLVLKKIFGEEKADKLYNSANYDNFTLNFNIGNIPSKFYNIDTRYGWTNAWRKMYEMITILNLINENKTTKKFTHFDICGFPGAFIFATNHYIKTKTKIQEYDWYVQSYNEHVDDSQQRSYFDDKYKLVQKNPDKFLYGSIKSGFNGDITNTDNIKEYIKIFKDKSVDLVSSDCGLGIEWDKSHLREIQMIKIHFAQFICGISVLKKDGHIVMKNYSQMRPLSISIIYLMTKLFKYVYFVKPETSRQHGREIYLVGKNYYKNLSDKQIDDLISCVEELDNEKHINYSLFDKKNININLIKKIESNISNYYDNFIKYKDLKDKIFKNEVLSLKDEPKLIEKKINKMNYESKSQIQRFFIDYFRRMKYKKIANKDKLV